MSSAEVMTYEGDEFFVKRTPNKRFYFDDSDDEMIVAPRKIRKTLNLDSEEDSTTSDSYSTVDTDLDSKSLKESYSDTKAIKNVYFDNEDTLIIKRTPKKLFADDSDDKKENTQSHENFKNNPGKIMENEANNNTDNQVNYQSSKDKHIEAYSKVEPQLALDKLRVDYFKSISSYHEDEEDNVIEDVNNEDSDEEYNEEGYSNEDDDDDERDFPNHYLDRIRLFTEEQNSAFEYVIKLIKDPQFRRTNPRVVLVDGPAGTGKTELLKALCDYVTKSYKGHAIFTAATGVAALKYEFGRTAHSAFGFPLDVTYEEQQRCCINEYKSTDLSGADLIVLDEFQSVNIDFIDMLDLTLKDIMYSDKKFGGKVIVFGADFRQVVPVVPEAYDSCAFSPRHFIDTEQTKTFIFSQACRMGRYDIDYLNFIKKLGSDTLTTTKIPETLFINNKQRYIPLKDITFTTSLDHLMGHIFPEELLLNKPDKCARRSILAPTRKRVQLINDAIAQDMTETIILGSEDLVGNSNLFEEYFNSDLSEDKVFPAKDLEVWKGCLCMIMRSMYIRSSKLWILNGTKVIVEKVQEDSDVIWVRKVGDDDDNLIPIEKYTFKGLHKGQMLVRVQFPLMLCYATTIHKSQGQTFDMVGVDLQEHVFRHGQLYLALSRVRNRNHMVVCVNEYQVINDVAHAVNIVNRNLVTN